MELKKNNIVRDKNVIDFFATVDNKKKLKFEINDTRDLYESFYHIEKFYRKIVEKSSDIDSKCGIKTSGMDIIIKRMNESEKGIEEVKSTFGKSISIFYIVLSTMLMSFFVSSFIITIFFNYYIIHPFISFISSIGSIGLIITSAISLRDQCKMISGE